jgi:hypothetical protein
MNYRKPVTWIVVGSMVFAVYSCEALTNPHVDTSQYEEPSSMTYEFPNSTATATISYSLLPGDFYLTTPDPKLRIKF